MVEGKKEKRKKEEGRLERFYICSGWRRHKKRPQFDVRVTANAPTTNVSFVHTKSRQARGNTRWSIDPSLPHTDRETVRQTDRQREIETE